MKFTLATFVAIVGAASAISVDAGLVKRQCIASGGLCFTSITEVDKPCCGGLLCNHKSETNQNVCEPAPPKSKRDAPAPVDARGIPAIPDDEPRWG